MQNIRELIEKEFQTRLEELDQKLRDEWRSEWRSEWSSLPFPSSMRNRRELDLQRRRADDEIRLFVKVAVDKMWDANDRVPAAEEQWVVDRCGTLGEAAWEGIEQNAKLFADETHMVAAGYLRNIGGFDPRKLAREELSHLVDERKLLEAAQRRRTPFFLRFWWQAVLGMLALIAALCSWHSIAQLLADWIFKPKSGP